MGKKERKKIRIHRESDFEERLNPYATKLDFEPDEYQLRFMKTIQTTAVTFVNAPSGTGKTTLALREGMEALRKGICQRIFYIRFPDDRYLKQGFLPGDLAEKEAFLFFPFFDAAEELNMAESQIKALRLQEQIILTTDTALRGRNWKNAFVIVDEAQNAKSLVDLQLVLTRVHDKGGKVVVIGHSGQVDNKKVERTKRLNLTPFEAYAIHMSKQPFAKICELKNNYRGKISQWADQIMESAVEL